MLSTLSTSIWTDVFITPDGGDRRKGKFSLPHRTAHKIKAMSSKELREKEKQILVPCFIFSQFETNEYGQPFIQDQLGEKVALCFVHFSDKTQAFYNKFQVHPPWAIVTQKYPYKVFVQKKVNGDYKWTGIKCNREALKPENLIFFSQPSTSISSNSQIGKIQPLTSAATIKTDRKNIAVQNPAALAHNCPTVVTQSTKKCAAKICSLTLKRPNLNSQKKSPAVEKKKVKTEGRLTYESSSDSDITNL